MDIDVKNLHPLEVRLLRHVASGEDITPERIIRDLDYKVGQSNQAFSWLTAKGLVEEKSRSHRISYELTDFGRSEQLNGLPAERIFAFITENGPHTLPEIAEALSLEKSDVGSAFGLLSSKGSAKMNEEKKAAAASAELPGEVRIQRSLLDKAAVTGSVDENDPKVAKEYRFDFPPLKEGRVCLPRYMYFKKEFDKHLELFDKLGYHIEVVQE